MKTLKTVSRVTQTDGFKRDLKKLRKRYRTLCVDLATFLSYGVELFHSQGAAPGRIKRVQGLGFDEPPVYIAKRFACRALKGTGGRSGIRVVWAWFPDEGRVELVEMFYKGDQAKPDFNRIRKQYPGRG